MNISIRGFIFLSVLATLFSACAKKKMVISNNEIKHTQINTWTQKENPKEDVDVSDIDNGMIQTESNTSIQETLPTRIQRIPFPIEEYARLSKKGQAGVQGKIYLKTVTGALIAGKHTRLYLNPLTSYSKQWYTKSYMQGYKMEKADDKLFNYLRFTASTEQGDFAFYGVPAGKYYLIGTVSCASECGYEVSKNIRIAKEIEVGSHTILQQNLIREIQ